MTFVHSPPSGSSRSPLHPLYALAKEVEARGLAASVDVSVSVVDAYLPDAIAQPGALRRARVRPMQRAILRPDPVSAHPWWWLLWPEERFQAESTEPEVTRLLPVEELSEVARRIRNILILDSTQ